MKEVIYKHMENILIDEQEQILKATHFGKITIGDKELPCAVLEDGTRILSSRAIFKAFDRTPKGNKGKDKTENTVTDLPSFIGANNLKPLIDKAFSAETHFSIKYIAKDKRILDGYKAEILPIICDIYLQARQDGILLPQQLDMAHASEILVRSLSVVGLVALIDEATGYQLEREKDELQKLLSVYINSEFISWAVRFPNEFYKEIYRLRGWEYKGKAKTPYVGKITNWLAYYRLPEGILEELKRLNPILNEATKYRKHNLWQRLSKEQGVKHLDMLISTLTSMMRGCDTWEEFEKFFRKSFDVSIDSTIDRPVVQEIKEDQNQE